MNETTPRSDDDQPERSGTLGPRTNEDQPPVPPDHVREHARARSRRRFGGCMDYVITMVVALIIAVLVKTFLIQPFYIPSSSMVPTLETNDKIIVSKLTPGVFDLHRGDVVVFQDPGGWLEGIPTATGTRATVQKALSYVGLAPDPSQDHLVKRLIGLPGDHVVCRERGAKVRVNGATISEPYINPATGACQYAFDVKVPAGKLWVLGDNRYDSADSSYHQQMNGDGFVPEKAITGKAEVIMWPISRWTGLGSGEKAFARVPSPS